MRTLCLIGLLVAGCVTAFPQQLSGQAKAESLAANFNKHKDKVKLRDGVRTEKYLDVRSEPVVRQNLRDYAGVYQAADLGYLINISVGTDGSLQITGSELGQPTRTFRLENARVNSGVLTASQVYQDGTRERFEGVFLNRTARTSPTDAGQTTFGLGVVLKAPVEMHGITFEKVFYQKQ